MSKSKTQRWNGSFHQSSGSKKVRPLPKLPCYIASQAQNFPPHPAPRRANTHTPIKRCLKPTSLLPVHKVITWKTCSHFHGVFPVPLNDLWSYLVKSWIKWACSSVGPAWVLTRHEYVDNLIPCILLLGSMIFPTIAETPHKTMPLLEEEAGSSKLSQHFLQLTL